MIALDTNVLLRFVVRDDPAQAEAARHLFDGLAAAGEAAFVSLVTLVEFAWVLEDTYSISKNDLTGIIERLLAAPTLAIEQEDVVRRSLESQHGDFSDRVIHFAGAAGGCERTVTFDRKFARLEGVELLRGA